VAHHWASASRAPARSFKRALRLDGSQPVARMGSATVSARLAAQVFLREVLRALRRQRRPAGLRGWLRASLGLWPHTRTIPVPVDGYETYSREVRTLARRCGVARVRSLDEPVAAALGYGLDIRRAMTLLVVDFGGGTLDLAVVRLGGPEAEHGRSEVLATLARELGGDTVDEWLMEEWCQRSGNVQEQVRHDLKWRTEALKQRLSRPAAPPDALERLPFTRQEFIALLEKRGLYQELTQGVEQVLREAELQIANCNGSFGAGLLTAPKPNGSFGAGLLTAPKPPTEGLPQPLSDGSSEAGGRAKGPGQETRPQQS